MEMEMQQLLSMGFPDELAAQALAATGGKSIVKATEWILSHKTDSNPTLNPSPTTTTATIPADTSTPCQPKIDRFFQFQSKPSSQLITCKTTQLKKEEESTHHHPKQEEEEEDDGEQRKRPKHHHHHQHLLTTKRNSLSSSFPNMEERPPHQPLSERMRPRTVNDVVGQDHLLATNSPLRSAINCNRLFSIVFWGPPGTGKTSIARAIVNSSSVSSSYRFVALSAVNSGVKDVRDAVEEAKKQKSKHKRTVLFVDEVHRFNKSQQDSFLPVIEDGSVVFMGATTENPSFHLITPLLSRCRVLTLNPLKPHHVATLLRRAAADSEKGLASSVGMKSIVVDDKAIEFLSENCDGDGRVALNALEVSSATAVARLQSSSGDKDGNGGGGNVVVWNEGNYGDGSSVVTITLDDAKEALQCKHLAYDKGGEEHYNLISALHKSMRGSDANAAIYWLARMLEGGEEPLYIARRLIRFASEDVGLADPSALNQAVACYQACHFLGMPECNVNLAQCVAYLALAPKSVSVYQALEAAQKVVRESVGQNEGVPLHLRNAPTKLMKELGYGKGYIYPPDNPSSSSQSYLPPSLQGYQFLYWPNSTGTDR